MAYSLEIAVKYITKIMGNTRFFRRKLNVISGSAVAFNEIAGFLRNKIEGLVVMDRNAMKIQDVPCDFSTDDIMEIGPLKFDLFKIIEEYITQLMFIKNSSS